MLERTFYHNTIQEWAIAMAIVLASALVAKTIYWIFGRVVKTLTKRTKTMVDDLLVDMLEEPLVVLVAILGAWYGLGRLTVPAHIADFGAKAGFAAIAIIITWAIVRTVDAFITAYVAPLTQRTDSDLDDQLMPILRKGVRGILWCVGIIVALNNAGYNVGALIAGLGIGGLALAMAAKDTVGNIFGGISVFVDKPFTLRDRIKIEGFDGFVEEVGIRSTRIRNLEGRMIVIPNHKFTDSIVENVTSEPSRRIQHKLGLQYDTSPAKMQEAVDILRSIVQDHQDQLEELCQTSFNEFGDFSLVILFMCYIRKGQDLFLVQSSLSMEILSRFNEAGLQFAFPTQTLHLQGQGK